MKNNEFNNFIKEMKSIQMTTREKNNMREYLYDFSQKHHIKQSPYTHLVSLTRKTFVVTGVLFLGIGSIGKFLSAESLPGDTFYPVKLAQEEIKAATVLDPQKKISYEIKRTELRIQEAVQLIVEENLDENTQSQIANNINEQANKVQEEIAKIQKTEPEQALVLNSELKSSITANTEILRAVSKTEDTEVTSPAVAAQEPEDNDIDTVEEINTEEIDTKEPQAPDVTSTEIQDSEDEISTENLLESLDETVLEIEAQSIQISTEITKSEEITETEVLETPEDSNASDTITGGTDAALEEFMTVADTKSEVTPEVANEDTEAAPSDTPTEETIPSEVEKETSEEINSNNQENITPEGIDSNNQKDTTPEETINLDEVQAVDTTEPEDVTNKESSTESTETTPEEILTEHIQEIAHNLTEPTPTNTILETKNISTKIKSLEDVLLIQEQIEQFNDIEITSEDKEKIDQLRIEAEISVNQAKYKTAFVQLQSILELYHKHQKIQDAQEKLGIHFEEEVKEIIH